MKDIYNVICRPKVVNLLLQLSQEKTSYCSKIYKSVDLTYAHANNLIVYLIMGDLIEKETKGRIRHIKLTEKGIKICKNLSVIRGILNG